MLAGASKFPGVPSNTHCFQRTSTHRYKSQRATGTILFRAIESGSQGLTQVLTGFRERGGSASVPVCGHLLGVCLWHHGGSFRAPRGRRPQRKGIGGGQRTARKHRLPSLSPALTTGRTQTLPAPAPPRRPESMTACEAPRGNGTF